MAVPQQKFREIVFRMLYSYDMGKPEEEEIVNLLMKELSVTKKIVNTAQEKVKKILEKQQEIDTYITKTTISYEFERIQRVEVNILRLGIYELFFEETIPPKVAIAEAIRLSRKFGTPESASFVNAILDNIYKASLGEQIDTKEITESVEAMKKSEIIANEAAKTQQQPDES